MTRPDGAWVPDGRAKAILADCEASLAALDGLPIDLYLIHAPDPRTPWRTSVRALARLADEGVVRHVGLSNVNRRQLDEALELAPVAAIQVALSPFDDRALRGGVVERCDELGIALIAHSPFGGPRRRGVSTGYPSSPRWRIGRRSNAGRGGARVAAGPLAGRHPDPRGAAARDRALRRARRAPASTGRPAARSGFGRRRRPRRRRARERRGGRPRDGRSRERGRAASPRSYVARGYLRLNRDERGGTLRDLADALDRQLRRAPGGWSSTTPISRARRGAT